MTIHFHFLLPILSYISSASAVYQLHQNYSGLSFFDGWDFFSGEDPTHGFVRYQTKEDAVTHSLIKFVKTARDISTQAWIGVDSWNVTPNGRPSVRIESRQSFHHGLFVADIAHMPGGICATWPAFWMLGADLPWPHGGEIDIVEGVNEANRNAMTLHTTEGAAIDMTNLTFSSSFTGRIATNNCDINAENQPSNAGCSVSDTSNESYGTAFNAAGGGVFATEWTSGAIKIWFFARAKIPGDIKAGKPVPGAAWGKPASIFSGTFNVDQYFQAQKLIIDTTFCGDWAGAVWPYSSCVSKAATCNEFVRDTPIAFRNAFWLINSIKIFQDDGLSVNAPSMTPSVHAAIANSTKTMTATLTITLTQTTTRYTSSAIVRQTNLNREATTTTAHRHRTRIRAFYHILFTTISYRVTKKHQHYASTTHSQTKEDKMADTAPALLIIIITLFFPPVGVAMVAGCGADLFINICLTLLGYIPGHIHAFYIEYVYFDRRERARRGELTGQPASGVYSDRVQAGGMRGYGTV